MPIAITPEQITKLKADHPGAELHVIRHPDGDVVVRGPTGPEHLRFMEDIFEGGQQRALSQKMLVRACAVWPPEADLLRLIEERPFIVAKIVDEISDAFGGQKVAERKKL
jgi:hypothetical protein